MVRDSLVVAGIPTTTQQAPPAGEAHETYGHTRPPAQHVDEAFCPRSDGHGDVVLRWHSVLAAHGDAKRSESADRRLGAAPDRIELGEPRDAVFE